MNVGGLDLSTGTQLTSDDIRALEAVANPPAPSPIVVAPDPNSTPVQPAPESAPESSLWTEIGTFFSDTPGHQALALLIVAGGLFLLGVGLSCLMPGRNGTERREILVSAPFAFLFSGPIWIPLLQNGVIKTNIAPINALLEFFLEGALQAQLFGFGVMMIFGFSSHLIFRMLRSILAGVMALLRRQAPAPPPPSPAGG